MPIGRDWYWSANAAGQASTVGQRIPQMSEYHGAICVTDADGLTAGRSRLSSLSAAGWSSLVARRAHNPKVAGSNPAPAIHERSVISMTGRSCFQIQQSRSGTCPCACSRFASTPAQGSERTYHPAYRVLAAISIMRFKVAFHTVRVRLCAADYGRASASMSSTSNTSTLLGGMLMLPLMSRTVEKR